MPTDLDPPTPADLPDLDPIPEDPRLEARLHLDHGLCPRCGGPLGQCAHTIPEPAAPFAIRAGRLEHLLKERRQRDLATGVAARQPILAAAENLQRALASTDAAGFSTALALLDIVREHLATAQRVLRVHTEKPPRP